MTKTQANTVPELEELIGYTFNRKAIAWEALQTKQYGGFAEGNKRLALIGDAALKIVVLKKWYSTSLPRGRASQLIEQVARNDVLTDAGRELGLDSLIVKNVSNWNVEISGAQIADAMEAVIGAVYIDGGEASLAGVMSRMGLDI